MSSQAERGRRGGLRGGPARSKALAPERRSDIASAAAKSRWQQSPKHGGDPQDLETLLSFVANYGAACAKETSVLNLEDVVVRAVEESRNNSALTRMLPVFLWRVRNRLDCSKLMQQVKARRTARALGYFLQLADTFGQTETFKNCLVHLRMRSQAETEPDYLLKSVESDFLSSAFALELTPLEAKEWGLVTGVSTEHFSSYFKKVSHL